MGRLARVAGLSYLLSRDLCESRSDVDSRQARGQTQAGVQKKQACLSVAIGFGKGRSLHGRWASLDVFDCKGRWRHGGRLK